MKKIKWFLVLIILISTSLNVAASTNTIDRNSLENYGVNKKWNITDSNRSNVLKSKKVDALEKVYDFADILTDSEETEIYNKLKAFTEKYNTDFVFISDVLPYSYDSENEDYIADFYDYNDFGIDFEKYSGIVLFRNAYEADPYYDLYLFGNSQLYFDNYRKNQSLDGIYDNFRSHQYLMGVNKFIDYCNSYYEEGIPYELQNYYVDDNGYLHKVKPPYKAPIFSIFVIDSIITLIVLLILVGKNKMVKKKIVTMNYLDKKSINFTKKNDQFLRSHVSSYTHTSSSSGGSSSGGGYHSSGGSSGGGHSSGGGRHG